MLENGKTAQETFKDTVAELEGKVRQLGDDLASQDAHAFLVHSRFLKQKFGAEAAGPAQDAPPLALPDANSAMPNLVAPPAMTPAMSSATPSAPSSAPSR